MQQHLLFIHGFNSSPQSLKAQRTKAFLAKHYPEVVFHCPQLATSPNAAIAQLETIIETEVKAKSWSVVGSSLGGYFASYLSEKYQLPAVLVNPAIKPYELLEDYIGQQVNPYSGIVYQVTETHMNELKLLETKAPDINSKEKNNYLVMVQTGDEVLDYQQAVEKYQHCQLFVEQGGDHSFVNFEQQLAKISDFLQLKRQVYRIK